jgi:hypothetical protein
LRFINTLISIYAQMFWTCITEFPVNEAHLLCLTL